MKNKKIAQQLLSFYIIAERLKTVMRHSLTSNTNRQESTAEHSWMLCLIAMTIFEHLELKVDQFKVLKLLIIHDLAEVLTGDIPAFDTKGRIGKYEKEKTAMLKLVNSLPETTQKDFMELWEECEKRETQEAKVAQAIDKFEAPLQHNIFGVDKWDQNDFDVHGWYKFDIVAIDPFLKVLRNELEDMSRDKITKANQIHRLPKDIQKRYLSLNKKHDKK